MLYDKNPAYPHYDHLPYAKEPWKTFYVFQRLFTTLGLVPFWVIYYTLIPRSLRPRASWNLRQIIGVKFRRRIYKVTEVAGVTWETRDPEVEPDGKKLKETRFEWAEPLKEEWRTGIVDQRAVPFKRVGCYVWPKDPSKMRNLDRPAYLGVGAEGESRVQLVGVFMHGGGYCHMSAHESSMPSRIPRNLIKRGILDAVYSVEYRLLQHAPFPAVVQDAAAVYSHVVETYQRKGQPFKVILLGDSSGGNLVLALARWIRDEAHLPLPDGLLLLSPSCDTTSALPATLSSYIPRPNKHSDYLTDTPEPRALLQRTFLGFASTGPSTPLEEQRLMEIVHSEYVSPCSPVVLKRWRHEVKQDPEGEHQHRFVRTVMRRLPTALRVTRDPDVLAKSSAVVPCPPAVSERARGSSVVMSKGWLKSLTSSRNVVPLVGDDVRQQERVLTPPPTAPAAEAVNEDAKVVDPEVNTGPLVSLPVDVQAGSPATLAVAAPATASDASKSKTSSASSSPSSSSSSSPSPAINSNSMANSNALSSTTTLSFPQPTHTFPTLFHAFPRTMVVCGDAERLVREVRSLVGAMEKDGVDLDMCWAEDACHDVLIMNENWWDKKVLEAVWKRVGEWAEGFRR